VPEAAIKLPKLCFCKESSYRSRTMLRREELEMAPFPCNRNDPLVAIRLALNQLVYSILKKNTKVIYIL
jgi:hypothetical protein